ncbi:hypothetical protein FRC07_012419 [Ceratobasidium sp. 392]|nr:hypothetical protein FRC07_012419 [Ceratobasidium sp. 392]
MDANLGLCWSSLQGHNASGTLHRFPQCQEVRLVSRNASEALQPVQYQGADYLAAILVQLVYPTVSRVILETDMADMSAMFTTRLIKREGPADSKVVLEIQTKRDEVVRSVERAICSHIPQCTDPQSPRMHIIVRGPTYGTDFILDESTRVSRITQRMWREKATEPEASHSDRNKGRAQLRMEDEDHEVLGAKELVASLSRRNAIPAKRKIADVANQVPLRRSPRQKSHKWSNAPLVPSQPRMILPKPKRALPPRPSSIRCTSTSSENAASGGPGCSTVSLSQPNEPFFEQAPLPRQTPARYAGKLAAGMPAIVEQVMQQLTNEDLRNQRPNSCCPKLPQRVVGVEDPVARAELDMFIGTYYARRYAAQCRLANLAKMKELREEAKAKPDHNKQADDIAGRDGKVVGDAAEGPISKRRRRA